MDNIKDLVKKHFNLVEPSVEAVEETFTEETAEMSFGEIKSADGELTLAYEGEELAQGLPIFVVTGEGNIPAPDGEHALEGGITIVTADGKIEAITKTEEGEVDVELPAEVEAEEHEEKMADHSDEEEMEEEDEEAMEEEEEMMDDKEEIIVALADVVKEMMEELEEKMTKKMSEMEEKYSAFASAPASKKTLPSQFKKESAEENFNHKSMIESLIAQKKRK